MIRRALIIVVAAIAALPGCKRYTYTVSMKPVPAWLERSLTVDGGSVQPGGRTPPARAVTTTLSGVFTRVNPADIGGAGSYTSYPTSLGTLHVYAERFRGDDDLAGQWERQQRAIDTGVDLLLTWIDAKLAGEQGVDKLRVFIDRQFRRDVKNAALYARIATEQARPPPDERPGAGEQRAERALTEFVARMAQYAVERGYFAPSDCFAPLEAPQIARDFESPGDGGRAMMALIRRQMLRRMGRDEDDQAFRPTALIDDASWNASFRAHVADSAAARSCLSSWAAAAQPGLEAEPPELQLQCLGLAAVRLHVLVPYDEVRLTLSCPERPLATNGSWDEGAKSVSWSGSIETEAKDADGLPLLAYAAWSAPNKDAQVEHFGSTVLRNRELAEYCLWRAGLPPVQASQWDSFLATLRPAADASERIAAFRFAEDPAQPTGPRVLAHAIDHPD